LGRCYNIRDKLLADPRLNKDAHQANMDAYKVRAAAIAVECKKRYLERTTLMARVAPVKKALGLD
jgi:hypothetical protein